MTALPGMARIPLASADAIEDYLEARAGVIAAPKIAAAEQECSARLREAGIELQRRDDLVTELRARLAAMERELGHAREDRDALVRAMDLGRGPWTLHGAVDEAIARLQCAGPAPVIPEGER